jgi:hypothetical protein
MGTQRDDGYSAEVQGFFVVQGGCTVRLAKTNGSTFVVAESCEFDRGTVGELLVIVDGRVSSREIKLIDRVALGQTVVSYEPNVPF